MRTPTKPGDEHERGDDDSEGPPARELNETGPELVVWQQDGQRKIVKQHPSEENRYVILRDAPNVSAEERKEDREDTARILQKTRLYEKLARAATRTVPWKKGDRPKKFRYRQEGKSEPATPVQHQKIVEKRTIRLRDDLVRRVKEVPVAILTAGRGSASGTAITVARLTSTAG